MPFAVQNLVIDSKVVPRVNISRVFNKNLVSLEGDFRDYFDIQTDEDRKMEVTAFLAPDLMNALITDFSTCDIELFDNKIRFYFVFDHDELSAPVNTFMMFERNMNVVKSFLERFESKFVHLKTKWRAISGEQSLNETKPRIIEMRARNKGEFTAGSIFLLMLSIISFRIAVVNFTPNIAVSAIAMIIFLAIFAILMIYVVKSVRYFHFKKVKVDYIDIFIGFAIMAVPIMGLYANLEPIFSPNAINDIKKQETSLSKANSSESKQLSEANLTVSKRVDVIYDKISGYKELQGGEIDWEDETQIARLKAKIPYSFRVIKTSDENFAVVPEEIYLVKGKVCGENPLEDFSYYPTEAALFVGLGEKTICRQL